MSPFFFSWVDSFVPIIIPWPWPWLIKLYSIKLLNQNKHSLWFKFNEKWELYFSATSATELHHPEQSKSKCRSILMARIFPGPQKASERNLWFAEKPEGLWSQLEGLVKKPEVPLRGLRRRLRGTFGFSENWKTHSEANGNHVHPPFASEHLWTGSKGTSSCVQRASVGPPNVYSEPRWVVLNLQIRRVHCMSNY